MPGSAKKTKKAAYAQRQRRSNQALLKSTARRRANVFATAAGDTATVATPASDFSVNAVCQFFLRTIGYGTAQAMNVSSTAIAYMAQNFGAMAALALSPDAERAIGIILAVPSVIANMSLNFDALTRTAMVKDRISKMNTYVQAKYADNRTMQGRYYAALTIALLGSLVAGLISAIPQYDTTVEGTDFTLAPDGFFGDGTYDPTNPDAHSYYGEGLLGGAALAANYTFLGVNGGLLFATSLFSMAFVAIEKAFAYADDLGLRDAFSSIKAKLSTLATSFVRADDEDKAIIAKGFLDQLNALREALGSHSEAATDLFTAATAAAAPAKAITSPAAAASSGSALLTPISESEEEEDAPADGAYTMLIQLGQSETTKTTRDTASAFTAALPAVTTYQYWVSSAPTITDAASNPKVGQFISEIMTALGARSSMAALTFNSANGAFSLIYAQEGLRELIKLWKAAGDAKDTIKTRWNRDQFVLAFTATTAATTVLPTLLLAGGVITIGSVLAMTNSFLINGGALPRIADWLVSTYDAVRTDGCATVFCCGSRRSESPQTTLAREFNTMKDSILEIFASAPLDEEECLKHVARGLTTLFKSEQFNVFQRAVAAVESNPDQASSSVSVKTPLLDRDQKASAYDGATATCATP